MSQHFSSTSPAAGPSKDRADIDRPKPFLGHRRWINAVCYSPDGKHVATGGNDPPIRIWDSDTSGMMFEPKCSAEVLSLSYSPDGKRLVSGDVGGKVCIWDTSDGQLVVERENTHQVNTVAYSPDNQHIASRDGGNRNSARIWGAEDLTQTIEISHPASVQSVDFSPDGSRLATACFDGKIRIFDVTTSALVVGPLEGHTKWVNAVTYSPNGGQLASCSYDCTIRIWDATTGTVLLCPLEGHIDNVTCVVYSPDGKQLVSGSDDNTIRLWDTHTGDLIGGPVRGHDRRVGAVGFAPDGTQFITGAGDASMRVWDAQILEILSPKLTADEKDRYRLTGPFRGHLKDINAVAYFPDGERIATASGDCTIRIWNVQTGEEVLKLLRHGRSVTSIAISADGARLVGGAGDDIIVWDTRTGKVVLGPLKGDFFTVRCVKFSPDDRLIAAARLSGKTVLWDSRAGEQLSSIRGGPSICFSPDGSRLGSSLEGGSIAVWDVSTGEIVAGPFQGYVYNIHSMAFSPDGLRIVSGSWDDTVHIWDVTTGTLEPLKAHRDMVSSVSYSPDGTKICTTSDSTIWLWDASTNDLLPGPLRAHHGIVTSAAFSPDGKRIVTGLDDWTIELWDVTTAARIHETNPGSIFDLPATARPQDFSTTSAAPQDNPPATTLFYLSRLRSAIFRTPRPVPDALELEDRNHRIRFRPIRTAYIRTKSYLVIASRRKTAPEQPLRDVSDHGSASNEEGRVRDGANKASGQGTGDNTASVLMGQHAEIATSNAVQHMHRGDQHSPLSMAPFTPYATVEHSTAPQVMTWFSRACSSVFSRLEARS